MPLLVVKMMVDPEAGTITNYMSDGSVRQNAGCRSGSGYFHVKRHGRQVLVHRIIWEHVNGPIPEHLVIDHINGVRTDNRIENLRLVTRKQNQENQQRAMVNNQSSGVRGVHWHPRGKSWQVSIGHEGQQYYIGQFKSIEDAQRAYAGAAALFHTHNPYAVP